MSAELNPTSLAEARERSRQLRTVAKLASNAPLTDFNDERQRKRRVELVQRLNELGLSFERQGAGDTDLVEDKHSAALERLLSRAQAAFRRGEQAAALETLTSQTRFLDGLLATRSSEPEATQPTSDGKSALKVLPPREGYRSMDVVLVREAAQEGLPAQPVMRGNFAVFNEWTEIYDLWEGEFLERIAPGAFTTTFAEDRDNIRVLFQHGRDAMMGSKPMGTIDTLEETKVGASYRVPLFRGIPELIMEGLDKGQYGASFRFEAVREELVDKPKPSDYNPRAIPERTLLEVRVAEFGPVTFPAYTSATAGLRSRSLTSKFGRGSAGRSTARSGDGGVTTDEPAAARGLTALEMEFLTKKIPEVIRE